jgi:hypothetical protein
MKQQRTKGAYTDSKNQVVFDLPVVSYEEDKLQVIYAPSLDVFGYGKTERDAMDSFKIALEEFIRYTTNKKTLTKVLENMGWVVKPKKRMFKAPSLGYLIDENKQFNEIFNHKNFRKFNEQIGVPMYA